MNEETIKRAREAAEAVFREEGMDPTVVLHVVWHDEHFNYALASRPTEVPEGLRRELGDALSKTFHELVAADRGGSE